MSWIVSIVTIISIWLIGDKRIEGFYVGLFSQALWAVLIIQTQQWGLGLLTVSMVVMYIRAIQKWRKVE